MSLRNCSSGAPEQYPATDDPLVRATGTARTIARRASIRRRWWTRCRAAGNRSRDCWTVHTDALLENAQADCYCASTIALGRAQDLPKMREFLGRIACLRTRTALPGVGI